jgi:hypothetical protein
MRVTTTQIARLLLVVLALTCFSINACAAVNVVNGDFETGPLLPWPGYGSITGWSASSLGVGINPTTNGQAPFRNNGDNSTRVAFLQSGITIDESWISQSIAGFVVGQNCLLSLDLNSREAVGDTFVNPTATILLNDEVLLSSTSLFPPDGGIPPVGDTEPWYHLDIPFTAMAPTVTLKIASSASVDGDATLLVDNVRISCIPEPTSIVAWLCLSLVLATTEPCRAPRLGLRR